MNILYYHNILTQAHNTTQSYYLTVLTQRRIQLLVHIYVILTLYIIILDVKREIVHLHIIILNSAKRYSLFILFTDQFRSNFV